MDIGRLTSADVDSLDYQEVIELYIQMFGEHPQTLDIKVLRRMIKEKLSVDKVKARNRVARATEVFGDLSSFETDEKEDQEGPDFWR